MAGLYLTCGLCGRKQADGLLSRNAWGHAADSQYGQLQACPTCKESHSDWENKLVAAASNGGTSAYSQGAYA